MLVKITDWADESMAAPQTAALEIPGLLVIAIDRVNKYHLPGLVNQ
jgi:hypothetical protein